MTNKEFSRFYERWRLPLGMFALHITGDVDEAEDIVQEAFERVWKSVTAGTVRVSCKSMLYAVARNLAINRVVRQTDIQTVASSICDETSWQEDAAIEESERDAALWWAMEKMPPKRREVFLMAKRDGMRYKEIAEELGISVKTVENQVAAAVKDLRKALGGNFRDLPKDSILIFF